MTKSHFHHLQNNEGIIHFGDGCPPADTTVYSTTIRPGTYTISYAIRLGGWFLKPQILRCDGLIDLPDSTGSEIVESINHFFTEEVKAKYAKYNFLYRRGILMYGPPGTGKSAIVYKVINHMIAKEGIVLWNCEPEQIPEVVNRIHSIQPDVQILVVWEEFERYKDNEDVLQLLDGGTQINNVVYLATTNYIEQIPNRLRYRPSRFAEVILVGPPTAEVRKTFLQKRIHPDDLKKLDNLQMDSSKEWIDRVVRLTEGWVIDQLTELIRSHFVIGLPVNKAIAAIHSE